MKSVSEVTKSVHGRGQLLIKANHRNGNDPDESGMLQANPQAAPGCTGIKSPTSYSNGRSHFKVRTNKKTAGCSHPGGMKASDYGSASIFARCVWYSSGEILSVRYNCSKSCKRCSFEAGSGDGGPWSGGIWDRFLAAFGFSTFWVLPAPIADGSCIFAFSPGLGVLPAGGAASPGTTTNTGVLACSATPGIVSWSASRAL